MLNFGCLKHFEAKLLNLSQIYLNLFFKAMYLNMLISFDEIFISPYRVCPEGVAA
jgi:hypothetical protein